MDAVEAATRLEEMMREMRWEICYGDESRGLANFNFLVKKHCRKLIHAVEMAEHCMTSEDEATKPPLAVVAKPTT